MAKKMSTVLFERYQHMVVPYAKSIWDLHKLSMDLDDLIQELKIKLFGAIMTYAQRWVEYRESGKYKPIEFEIYLRNTLINRSRDFIKKIGKSPQRKLSIDNNNRFDFGTTQEDFDIEGINKGKCEIGGVDIFKGLDKEGTKIFSLHLKGWDINKIAQMYPTASAVIGDHCEHLRSKRDTILEGIESSKTYFVQYSNGE